VGAIYSGQCRDNNFDDMRSSYAIRIRTVDTVVTITDRVAGAQAWRLDRDVGDFIVKRRDGLFAYQLAVVVDDAFQGITDVVRGNDLLDSTPKQVYLCRCLGFREVTYCHIPVIVDDRGEKFSKQNRAAAVGTGQALQMLRKALLALGQPTFPGASTTRQLVNSAIEAWNPAAIPRSRDIRYTAL
jgi:glutamyl-Q tRNA(Asp) synthetase